ncbi:MAG TPA: capsule assembly Wzi family protein [Longimicrobiales bacterium]
MSSLGLLVWLGGAAAVRAQEPPRFATPFIGPDHWSLRAARRLDALGLADPGFPWGERLLTRRELAALFQKAAIEATRRAPEFAPLALAYLDRFVEEFPATVAALDRAREDGFQMMGGAVHMRYERHDGRVRTGTGMRPTDPDWTTPAPIPDASVRASDIQLSAALRPHVAATVMTTSRSITADGGTAYDRLALAEGHVTATWGDVGVWFGRRAIGFGAGASGGIVLRAHEPVDGGGIYLTDPVRLPGPFRYLGPLRLTATLARIDYEGGGIRRPWFGTTRLAISPHPRLGIGLSRAIMFGGDGNSGFTLKNFAYMVVGKHSGENGEYDNQVVAVDVRYRPPVEAIPLVFYVEWGFDDSAGAWKDVPAILAAVEVPALPGWPEASLRIERTSFAPACCGNTIWYRNWAFRSGWTADGQPLGHPLGGHGTEWLARLEADLLDARLRVDARAFLRDRGAENLFAPDREGHSRGAHLTIAGRPHSSIEAFLSGGIEVGERDWRQTGLEVGARLWIR